MYQSNAPVTEIVVIVREWYYPQDLVLAGVLYAQYSLACKSARGDVYLLAGNAIIDLFNKYFYAIPSVPINLKKIVVLLRLF